MEALPRLIFGRELGFQKDAGRFIDDRQYVSKLMCLDTDVARVAENEENLFDSIPIYDIKFCPGHFHPSFVAITDELGYVTIADVIPGLEAEDKIKLKYQCHENALFAMDWSPFNDGIIATCAGDQTVKLWDLKKEFECTAILTGHGRSVKSVRFHPTSPHSVLSGSRDGGIRLWDVRVGGSAVNIIPSAHGKSKDEPVSVTDVLFQDEHAVISCGSKDGAIRLWDLRKTYSGYKKIVPVSKFEWKGRALKGFHSMCIDSHNNLYASTFHEVLKFNLSSELGQSDPAHFVAPDAFNSYIKVNVSLDGRFLISGSSLSEIYVWDTWSPSFEPFVVFKSSTEGTKISACVGSFSPVDNLTVVAGNDEGQLHVWRPYFDKNSDIKESSKVNASQKFVATAQSLSQEEMDRTFSHVDRLQITTKGANTREAQNSRLRASGCRSSYRKAVSSTPQADIDVTKSKDFDLRSLLRDLPNFVMDGTHPSLSDNTLKVARKSCWLDDMRPSSNPSVANFGTTEPKKRPATAMLACRDLNAQVAPQPKKLKLKLKLKAQVKTPKPRTPKANGQSPRVLSASRTPSTPSGRRIRKGSTDSGSIKSPMSSQNIMKYFSTIPRTPSRQQSPPPDPT